MRSGLKLGVGLKLFWLKVDVKVGPVTYKIRPPYFTHYGYPEDQGCKQATLVIKKRCSM